MSFSDERLFIFCLGLVNESEINKSHDYEHEEKAVGDTLLQGVACILETRCVNANPSPHAEARSGDYHQYGLTYHQNFIRPRNFFSRNLS